MILMLLGLSLSAQKDSSQTRPRYLYRIGVDVAKPLSLVSNDYLWTEFQLERINRKNGIMYLELGGGSGRVDHTSLRYSTSGVFFRWGLAQNIVYRAAFEDVETVSIGFRYGGAWCRNSELDYTITDPIYGEYSGTRPPHHTYKHWIEVSIGMKYNVYQKIYLGWTLRGAYKLNKPESIEASPILIPGFGRGDRTSAVGFNVFISYLL